MVGVAETELLFLVCAVLKVCPAFLLSRYTQIDGIALEILVLLRSKFGHTCSYTQCVIETAKRNK